MRMTAKLKSRSRDTVRYVALTATLLLATGCSAEGTSGAASSTTTPVDESSRTPDTATATTVPPAPMEESERLVDVGGRTLLINCVGTGSPTVILEAGLGGDQRTWEFVQPQVAKTSRTCSYDRAGLGGSEPDDTPRTTADAVADLRTLLDAADVEPPYVFVGFSFGGLVSQLFAATYPAEVAGIVLVESNHPREVETFEAHLTPEQIREDRDFVLANPEGMDPYRSAEQVLAAGAMPHVPLVVVSAGVSEGWPPGWDAKLFDRLWADLQRDLAGSIPGGRQVIAENSRHAVPTEAPQVVVQAIGSVLSLVES